MGVIQVLVFSLLPKLALLILAAGLVWRLYGWAATPVPLRVSLHPAPASGGERLLRWLGDLLFMPLLRRSDPWAWRGAMALHYSLLVVALGHVRLFIQPAPAWTASLARAADFSGPVLVAALVYLLARRLLIHRLYILSRWSDFLILLLLLALAASGLCLAHLDPPDLIATQGMLRAVLGRTHQGALPTEPLLMFHFILACLLAAVFPFSKLVHGLALAFSPVRYDYDDSRTGERVNPWEKAYTGDAPSRESVRAGEPELYTLDRYRKRLQGRWAAGGVRRVLGAAEREAARSASDDGLV